MSAAAPRSDVAPGTREIPASRASRESRRHARRSARSRCRSESRCRPAGSDRPFAASFSPLDVQTEAFAIGLELGVQSIDVLADHIERVLEFAVTIAFVVREVMAHCRFRL